MARPYLRQLLAGRDFAQGNRNAAAMENFVYLVGDRDAGECLIVDPAWDVPDLLQIAQADDMKVVGALCTHYHPDHIGGSIFGHSIDGLPTLLAKNPCPIHCNKHEADGIRVVTGVSSSDLVVHESGDKVRVGELEVELLHTPGHTPGSQCFRLEGALISGDTLFLQGCGRVDLPGGDGDELYYTLTQRLASLPGDLVLFPGHAYAGESAPLADVRRKNAYLQFRDLATWRRAMSTR